MEISPVRSWRQHESRRKHLGANGTLLHYSIVRAAPQAMSSHAPYIVGLVEVGGERVIAQIVDIDPREIREGLPVIGRLRRLFTVNSDAVIIYGVKFAPWTGE